MFLIRADGNARIGAGHLMRCMAVAEELALLQGKENICFVCADAQSANLASSHGFQSHVLGTDYRDMESELPLWQELAAKWAAQIVLLVDSYYVTDRYLAALRQFGYTVLMDDFGTHCYPVDCVINYNAPAKLQAYEKLYQGQDVRLLIGSRYVPLRWQFSQTAGQFSQTAGQFSQDTGQFSQATEQFLQSPQRFRTAGQIRSVQSAVQSPEVRYEASGAVYGGNPKDRAEAGDVLITTGGGDVENIAGKILKEIYVGNLVFHLVIGQYNPHFQEMVQMEKSYPNIHIHHNVSDMASLMRSCDIALTAGGFTIYELASMGVPFICFSYAENQELLTEYIGKEGIAGFAGAWHKEPAATLEKMKQLFKTLADSREMRNSYSIKEKAMIDGRGAERLAGALAGRNGYEWQSCE